MVPGAVIGVATSDWLVVIPKGYSTARASSYKPVATVVRDELIIHGIVEGGTATMVQKIVQQPDDYNNPPPSHSTSTSSSSPERGYHTNAATLDNVLSFLFLDNDDGIQPYRAFTLL